MTLLDWIDHDDRHSSIDLSSLGDPDDCLNLERPWSAQPSIWWVYFQSNGVELCALITGTLADAKTKAVPTLAVDFAKAARVMAVLQKEHAAIQMDGVIDKIIEAVEERN